MTREEINESLLSELAIAKQNNELSDKLKFLFYQVCRKNVESEKYKYFDDETKYIFVLNGYEACIKHAIKFNPEKSKDAFSYISVIIRSSIAGVIKQYGDSTIWIYNE